MRKGDFIYVPQNTRVKFAQLSKPIIPDLTPQPMRGIWLEERGKLSKIFLSGEVVYVKTSDISVWRENVGSSEVGEKFRPKFFVEEGIHQS